MGILLHMRTKYLCEVLKLLMMVMTMLIILLVTVKLLLLVTVKLLLLLFVTIAMMLLMMISMNVIGDDSDGNIVMIDENVM